MDERIIAGIVVALLSCGIGLLIKHLTNHKKHPCSGNIVFRDVCDERSKRIEDCVEKEIKNLNQRFDELREDMKSGFGRLEMLIKNGR